MRANIDVTPLQELLTVEITPESLKDKIAEIRYNYTNLALRDPDACCPQPQVAEDAYWLKTLEERLIDILEREAKEKGC